MPYFLFMLVVLVLSWGMMLNISKLLCDRMALQNAADNAALSAAVNQARTINLIARFNSLMAKVLYDSTFGINTGGWGAVHPERWGMGLGKGATYGTCILVPLTPQVFRNDASRVGSTVDIIAGGYSVCGFGKNLWFTGCERKAGAEAIMRQMQVLNGMQEGIFMVGPANSGRIARYIAKKQGTGPRIGDEDGSVELGFFGGMTALTLANIDLFFQEGGEYATGVLSLGLKKNTRKIEYFGTRHYGGSIPAVPPYTGDHGHYVQPVKIGDNWCSLHRRYESWYYADAGSFYRKRLYVCVRKKAAARSRGRYPLFGKWLGIEWPDMMAAAAASIYNTTRDNRGRPSFVLKRGPWEGTEIRENIEAYEDSKEGGWYAHLVPAGGAVLH